jgi:hypothetical protein
LVPVAVKVKQSVYVYRVKEVTYRRFEVLTVV